MSGAARVARLFFGVLLGLAPISGSAARAEPRAYAIDPEHAAFAVQISHLGYENLVGLFLQAGGSFTFDEATGAFGDLKIAVKSASFFTGHKERDDHVKSPDFLNARQYPEIVYIGRSVERTGERSATVHGELTLIGVTKPIDVAVTINKIAEYPYAPRPLGGKPYVIGISARAQFKRSAFGMTYGVDNGLVGDDLSLIMEIEADRQ